MSGGHLAARRTAPTGGHGLDALTLSGPPLPGAACARGRTELPEDTWFGGDNSDREPARSAAYDAARRICATCPAAAACLDRAFTRGERHGMFGGLHENERRSALRSRSIGVAYLLAEGLDALEEYGADIGPLIDVIARHREQAAA